MGLAGKSLTGARSVAVDGVPKVAKGSIAIDGDLNDAAWKQARSAHRFRR